MVNVKLDVDTVLSALERIADEAQMGPVAPSFSKAVVTSHLARMPRIDIIREYAKDLKAISAANQGFIELQTPCSQLRIDCNGLPALASLPAVVEEAAWAIRNAQPVVIGLANTGGMHALEVWVRVLAESGVVCLMSWNGGPYAVVPHGSTAPFFGTNPFAYSIPTTGDPIVGDFATSQIAFMDLMAARRVGIPLAAGSGIDAEGSPANDAEEVFVPPDSARLLPMGGGPKGSALMLLLEYLTGAFVGAVMGREASPVLTAPEFGGFILLLPEGLFRPANEVRRAVSNLGDDIRTSTPVAGRSAVRLPGDLGSTRLTEAKTTGIELASETAALIGLYGDGMDLPNG